MVAFKEAAGLAGFISPYSCEAKAIPEANELAVGESINYTTESIKPPVRVLARPVRFQISQPSKGPEEPHR